MQNNTPTISKELQEQIEREAEAYLKEEYPSLEQSKRRFKNGVRDCVAIATPWAALLQDSERRRNEANALLSPLLDYGQSKEAGIPIGESITTVILQRAKQFQQVKKVLDRLKSVVDTYSYTPSLNPPMKHLQAIINEALASWKEEGKETVTDVVEYPEADILANTAFIKWRDKHLCWHPYKKLYEAWRGNDCYTLQEAYRQFLRVDTG